MKESGQGLNSKQRAFVEHYFRLGMIHGSGARAAREAGYKGHCDVTASKLLRTAKIQEYLTRLKKDAGEAARRAEAKRRNSAVMTAAERLVALSEIAQRGLRAARAEVPTPVDLVFVGPALRALKMLEELERGTEGPGDQFKKMLEDAMEMSKEA
jgi:phage terminase small subunit